MKYKKLLSIGIACALVVGLTACAEQPDTAMSEQINLGSYNGMPITFVKDKSDNPSKGFYIIDDINSNANKENNKNFEAEKLVGHYKDLNVFFVKDHTDAPGKGFYIFKNNDNQMVSSINMSTIYSSGKSTTQKTVGVVYTSAIQNPQAMNVKLDNGEIQDISQMSANEVIMLTQKLLKIAEVKSLTEKNTQQNVQYKLR